MVVNTFLFDFSLKSELPRNELESTLSYILSNYVKGVKKEHYIEMSDGGCLTLYTGDSGVFITVRLFSSNLITINIEFFKEESQSPILTYQEVQNLESEVKSKLFISRSKVLPSIKRGGEIDNYLKNSDERIFEYDIDCLLFQEESPYQKVEIAHSRTLGNMLILDGQPNLSDKDLIYTETLMQRGVEDYEGKEILILGGGDGALLHELLKEKPLFVFMIEIDEIVIKACKQYLRSCCGDSLDQMKGDNHEIIIGDCRDVLADLIKEGRNFDFVFGDLTDAPISLPLNNELGWEFILQIINFSFKILKPEGKFLTHCCGISSPDILQRYEGVLTKLDEDVNYSKKSVYVPSFLEEWIFYQIWRK